MPASSPVKEVLYKDLDIAFKAHPATGDVPFLTNTKAISRSVKNLVFTNLYERPYKSQTGSDILRTLFENFSPGTVLLLKQRVRDVIRNYEPRAIFIDCFVDDDTFDYNTLNVHIVYRPINAKEIVTIDLFIKRIR